MGPRMREDTEGELGVRDDRFFTPLRYVQNDIWVGGREEKGGGGVRGGHGYSAVTPPSMTISLPVM